MFMVQLLLDGHIGHSRMFMIIGISGGTSRTKSCSYKYQLRAVNGQFLSCAGDGASVTATSRSPSLKTETFTLERSSDRETNRVRIKLSIGNNYLKGSPGDELRADFEGTPEFDDSNTAIFKMTLG
ncbi:hypothetical protein C5167_008102, partial [Papaver somniferum]